MVNIPRLLEKVVVLHQAGTRYQILTCERSDKDHYVNS